MVTSEDITVIKEIVKETVTDSMSEMLDKVLIPYLDETHKESQREHEEITQEIKKTRHECKLRFEGLRDYIKGHENRIQKLEECVAVKN